MGTSWKIACATLAVLLVAVSGVFFLWNGKLSSANTKIDDLNTAVLSLSNKNTTLQASLDDTAAAKTKALADLSSMTTQQQQTQTTLTQTQGQLTTAQGQLTTVQGQLTDSKTQLTSAQSQLASANTQITGLQAQVISAQGQLATTQGQLTTLQSKYPLKDFASLSDLTAWVNAHQMPASTVMTTYLNECIAVQKAAMLDGYYLSVVCEPITTTVYDIYVTAIAAGTLYGWDIESPTIYIYRANVTR
jgi:capsule polysaccharide export protein KpsE/RkpR